MTNDLIATELEIPFSKVDEWEAVLRRKGACAAFWEAANWGYQKGIEDHSTIESD